MKKQQKDKWFAVGAGAMMVALLAVIGMPAGPIAPPVAVAPLQADCALVFDSPLSSHFDITITSVSDDGIAEKSLENMDWLEAKTMLLNFAAMQQMARQGFIHAAFKEDMREYPDVASNELLFEQLVSPRTGKAQGELIKLTNFTPMRFSEAEGWLPVDTDFEVARTLEELRSLMKLGVWQAFSSTPEELSASVALSHSHRVQLTILPRDAGSLLCSAYFGGNNSLRSL